jgi:hypothetical protein
MLKGVGAGTQLIGQTVKELTSGGSGVEVGLLASQETIRFVKGFLKGTTLKGVFAVTLNVMATTMLECAFYGFNPFI